MTSARLRTLAAATLAAVLTTGATAAVTAAPAHAAARAHAQAPAPAHAVVDRRVAFQVVDAPDQAGACSVSADGAGHLVRGTLVGPRRVVEGGAPTPTVDVLVHDAGTGGWFWHLRGSGRDYAEQLARHGRTSLVLDRLGYDRSPLADGEASCLQAQVAMLHQVVQELYSGQYRTPGTGAPITLASHVVVQGHGTGATIAQLEAQRFGDVSGLVLMSPVTERPSRLAGTILGGQAAACATGATYAAFGTSTEFTRALFASASARVTRMAVAHRNPTPCGDVASVVDAVASANNGTAVRAPVLVLRGSRDALSDGGVRVASTQGVTRRTIAGAGSALVLEKQAPQVVALVDGFLDRLDPRSL